MNNKVLLIDADLNTVDQLKQALELAIKDLNLIWVKDGKSALNIFKKSEFDLIILETKLPEISGDEILANIRKIDPYVEVFVYTNYEDTTQMKKLIHLGISEYINKGNDPDLWEIVEQVKNKLDPFSDLERRQLLTSIPTEMFQNN